VAVVVGHDDIEGHVFDTGSEDGAVDDRRLLLPLR
jgi:hypothetical protein